MPPGSPSSDSPATEAAGRDAPEAPARLKITEIFRSLQGESDSVGWPTVFVRLTGCPLRCTYCDTAYAFHGGQWQTLAEIVAAVEALATRRVCITGGEPLAQKAVLPLMTALCDAGYAVSLETSGALDINPVDPRVRRVVDLKTPDSGETDRNRWENISALRASDEVKFVIGSRADFEWAEAVVERHRLIERCPVLLSPVHGRISPTELAEWLLASGREWRLQIQLHKLLWGEVPGR